VGLSRPGTWEARVLEGRIDSRVVYDGPRARCATLTGSPVWGLGDRFATFAEGHGYRALSVHTPDDAI